MRSLQVLEAKQDYRRNARSRQRQDLVKIVVQCEDDSALFARGVDNVLIRSGNEAHLLNVNGIDTAIPELLGGQPGEAFV